MKYLLIGISLLLLFACNSSDKAAEEVMSDSTRVKTGVDSNTTYIHSFHDTVLQNKITDVLMKLPFVIKSNNYIDSFSDHRNGIAFLLENPGENETEVSVQAGYDGNDRFETYYRFFVDPKTLEIKVYDPVADKKLSLKAYLKSQKK